MPRHHVFGIRHHGPGSARSVRRALEELGPDVILVEGPPDGEEVLPLLAHAEMQPPVALLVYVPDQPQRAVYYPFAAFSPEWQAIHFGLSHGIPVRFMDLPQAHRLALEGEQRAGNREPLTIDNCQLSIVNSGPYRDPEEAQTASAFAADPLGALAEAAGYSDGESWWEHMVEHRRDGTGLFAGILEAMTALRSSLQGENPDPEETRLESLREAWMRQSVRAARREGFERIAVICGAWHAPALADLPPARADADLLKGLPKVRVQATWVPWTHGRLCTASGYGAGVTSPGWYHHLWSYGGNGATATDLAIRWMTRVARLLRDEDLDASSAHVIEAVRLAEALAALRDRPLPGLPELNEAASTVLCFGSDVPMRLIHERLVVGERLGRVPDETPMVPLQQDLLREQRRLRLPVEAAHRDLDLDLRKPNDLDRSRLLHRLRLLGIPWGDPQRAHGKSGTFHELWRLQWKPELAVAIIEAAVWGNTVPEAAGARVRHRADHAETLPELTALVDATLLSDLPDAIEYLMERVQAEAAVASDMGHLMDALPPLANVFRYGNVRRTDSDMLGHVIEGLVTRICIGLPGACASLNDDAAREMLQRLARVHDSVTLLQDEAQRARWQATLYRLLDLPGLHGLLAGRSCRLLLDTRALDPEEAARRMGLALSRAVEPAHAATWVEGFLAGSGMVLLHDAGLWALLDRWISELPRSTFDELLPLLRRTFSTFSTGERRGMGELARRGPRAQGTLAPAEEDLDLARAEAVLPLLSRLLGV